MSEEPVSGEADGDRDGPAGEDRARVGATRLEPRSVSLVILATLAVFYTLHAAADLVLPFVLAIVLNLLLQPLKRFLSVRLRLPAALASVFLIVALLSLIGAIAAAISVPASNWLARAPDALPRLEQTLGPLKQPLALAGQGLMQIERLFELEQSEQPPQSQPSIAVSQSSNLAGVGLSVLSGTRVVLGQLLTLVVSLFFLLWKGETLLRSVVDVTPRLRDKQRVVEISEEISRNMSGYLATITAMNALVGLANGVQTWAFGLPDPLLWAVLAFVLNYIPILGPLTGIVLFFIVGLFSFPTIWWALLPAGAYLLIHLAEGETITPMLLARRFTLNPVLVILSLFFWDWMWGVLGALLAVPLLTMLKIVCDHIPTLKLLGHVIGGGGRGRGAVA
ncbi:MAG: AI-2E family transporter [Acetobacteraceae bacterium]|nr:AI-2E family transporter [Acetobacteraceae bacterium]